MDVLTQAIEAEFKGRHPRRNAEAARVTYDHTILGGI